jgi:hypothetical protein
MGGVNAEIIASITTAAGTLVLAVATFASTRSANRASRVAERSLLAGLRPVLMHARVGDPDQKIGFGDRHWVHVEGYGAAFEVVDGIVYLAMALRNVGSGIAVLQGWCPSSEWLIGPRTHPPLEDFRAQSRDIYVAAGDVGFWQGAIREADDPQRESFIAAARDRTAVTIDLLYTDMHGGQRSVTRFSIQPVGDDRWIATVGRQWVIDGVSPR